MNLHAGGLYMIAKSLEELNKKLTKPNISTLYKESMQEEKAKIYSVLKDFSSYEMKEKSVWYPGHMYTSIFSDKNIVTSVFHPSAKQSWCGCLMCYDPFMVLENCGEYFIENQNFLVLQVFQTIEGKTNMGYFKFSDEELKINNTSISIECKIYELFT